MPRATTPSFITEIPLVVTSQDKAELLSRFQAGRQLYNALLNKSMVRMNLVRRSDRFQEARKRPYPGMESTLLEAWQCHQTNCKQVGIAESRKAHPPLEQFSSDSEKANQIDDSQGFGRKVSSHVRWTPPSSKRGRIQLYNEL